MKDEIFISEHNKNASIGYILSQGLTEPQTARERITEMVRNMGFRYIFWDTGYGLFFAALTIAIVLALYAASPSNLRYSAAVAVTPLTFLLMTVFAETAERASNLYDLKQTCRYTVRQITALRVVCYSVVGAVLTAVIAVIGAESAYEFLSIFPLCLSALFVCAALSLAVMRFLHQKWASAAFSAAWVFAGIALALSPEGKWEALLGAAPIAISAAIAISGAAAVVYQISRMLREVPRYVTSQ